MNPPVADDADVRPVAIGVTALTGQYCHSPAFTPPVLPGRCRYSPALPLPAFSPPVLPGRCCRSPVLPPAGAATPRCCHSPGLPLAQAAIPAQPHIPANHI